MDEQKTAELWLIRRDALPKRMVVEGSLMRSAIGLDTLLTNHVQSIETSKVTEVRILGPYAWPHPPLQLAAVTFAAGAVIGQLADQRTSIALSIGALALTFLLRLIQNVRQAQLTLAQIKAGKVSYFVAFMAEKEAQVRSAFPNAEFHDSNFTDNIHALTDVELRKLATMRISIVLIVTAGSLFVLSFLMPANPGAAAAMPGDILVYAASGLTLVTGALACREMFRVNSR